MQKIEELSLKAAIQECRERLNAINNSDLEATDSADPEDPQWNLIVENFNVYYLVRNISYNEEKECGILFMKDIDSGAYTRIRFEATNTKTPKSFAHMYLERLRAFCTRFDLKTPSELRQEEEIAFYGNNE